MTGDVNTGINKNSLAELIADQGVYFDRPDAWQRIEEHVGTHKYLLDIRNKQDVEWVEAARSWKQNVLTPLIQAAHRQEVGDAFPSKSMGDLYIELSDHWYYLKQHDPAATTDKTVISFTRKYGRGLARWMPKSMLRRLLNSARDGWERGRVIDERIRAYQDSMSGQLP